MLTKAALTGTQKPYPGAELPSKKTFRCHPVPPLTFDQLLRPVRRAGDRTIKTLNLSANNIGDAGALTLAAILKSNTTLEVLDLSSNVIDYDGITAIAEALTDNTSLKALHIRCRPVVSASCLA